VLAVRREWWPGLLALVAANVLPLAGVLALGWDLGMVLLLYWAESAVVLAFSLVKVVLVGRLAALFLVPFFLVHAGIFMGVHLVFLLTLFVERPDTGWLPFARELLLGTAVLFASHLVSFVANTLRRGERPAKAQDVMTGFYRRVIAMHLTILGGGFLLVLLGSPAWALALLVVLKTGVDATAHMRERARADPAPLDALAQRDLDAARADAGLDAAREP
jgi:Family of unknown function (DUF6498)